MSGRGGEGGSKSSFTSTKKGEWGGQKYVDMLKGVHKSVEEVLMQDT